MNRVLLVLFCVSFGIPVFAEQTGVVEHKYECVKGALERVKSMEGSGLDVLQQLDKDTACHLQRTRFRNETTLPEVYVYVRDKIFEVFITISVQTSPDSEKSA